MKKIYLTKQRGDGKTWDYVGDPLNPTTTFDMGMVEVLDRTEIRVDEFGAYVEREFVDSQETKEILANLERTLGNHNFPKTQEE